MSFILEQDYYNKAKGFSLEEPRFANFSFGCNSNDYDSFGVIYDSYPMYVRIFPLINGYQNGYSISKEGRYANLDSHTRDKECPKIAWGFSAYIFCHLFVIINNEVCNRKDCNYIIRDIEDINYYINETATKDLYLKLLWNDYNKIHSGIKYRGVSDKTKRIAFLKQHYNDEKLFWKRTEPILKDYLYSSVNQKAGKLLYDSIEIITKQYCKELKKRLNNIQYKWFYQTNAFLKKNTVKIFSGICAALLTYIYRDLAISLYQHISKLIDKF